MGFEIVWAPIGSSIKLADVFGGDTSVSLPHFVDDPNRHTTDGSFETVLNAKTLALGLLVTGGKPSPYIDFHGTQEQIRELLKLVVQDLRAPSEDELCTRAAGHLREQHGVDVAIEALRHGVGFVPDGCLTRGDLIVSLFVRATRLSLADSIADLREVADVFPKWLKQDTARCSNEKHIFYCGLAALTYLDLQSERETLIAAHREIFSRSTWLEQQVQRLRAARAGEVPEIRLQG